jgi:hypothetical protein
MLTFISVALFILLTTLVSPDELLLATNSSIKVPLIDVPMSLFFVLMLVAPLLLIALAIYLHIFYGYWLDYERDRQYINQQSIPPIESIPTLFSFPDDLSRILTLYVFYCLVPVVLLIITWKAWAFPIAGLSLTWVTGLVTGALTLLLMRRDSDHFRHLPDYRRQWQIPIYYGILVFIVLRMSYVTINAQSFQRPLVLHRADLTKAWLPRTNMRNAFAVLANFQEANLFGADLREADLRGANFQQANLFRANLQKTKLRGAKNLTQDQVNTACVYENTQLPEGLISPASCPEEP